ncbi:MAG: hypothetical protein HUU57_16465, partial [Bdellovibrio sp.]|nr:hypothetical protein [Bdellovibrio sp.]
MSNNASTNSKSQQKVRVSTSSDVQGTAYDCSTSRSVRKEPLPPTKEIKEQESLMKRNGINQEMQSKSLFRSNGAKTILCAILGSQMLSQSAFSQTKGTEIETILPNLYKFAKPLNQEEFDFLINPIVGLLSTECVPKKTIALKHKEDLQSACTLLPALKYFKMQTETLKDPELSPVQLTRASDKSHLELLYAGAWGTSFIGDAPKGQPRDQAEFTAEVMLTKVILQKALLSYAKLSVFWSYNENNDAKTYIVPKLIQFLEGRTLLGGLFERYRNHRCSISQTLAKLGTSLCQIEKTRLAAVVQALYQESSKDITRMLRAVSLLESQSVKERIKQISMLLPLNETLSQALNSSETANNMWIDFRNGSSLVKQKIQQDVNNLTKVPIQLKNEDQVSSYVFTSAVLALKDLEEVSFQL